MSKPAIDRDALDHFHAIRESLHLADRIAQDTGPLPARLVYDLQGEPSYSFVPLAHCDRLVGFLRLNMSGELLAFGRYGQGDDLAKLPRLDVLSPEAASRAIAESFADQYGDIPSPVLVHDGPPERITWMAETRDQSGSATLLFWAFGESYARPKR